MGPASVVEARVASVLVDMVLVETMLVDTVAQVTGNVASATGMVALVEVG